MTNARNCGAAEARYPHLAYLDDDCSVGVDWLSQLVSEAGLAEQVSVVAGRVAFLDYDFGQKVSILVEGKIRQGGCSFKLPGSQPRLLENPVYVCEENMAIALSVAGGEWILGMDQFMIRPWLRRGVYLLEQVKRQGGKVAFCSCCSGSSSCSHSDPRDEC
ncbi:MAG: glycosyltransferase family 2 protein [Anaerolineales bacterium]|nr:glycosyltransferase family 2 protein [Anaerolineales bacterium]